MSSDKKSKPNFKDSEFDPTQRMILTWKTLISRN